MSEDLSKSKNARIQRAKVTPDQADARLRRYAASIGLRPHLSDKFYAGPGKDIFGTDLENDGTFYDGFPRPSRNILPYDKNSFYLDHELGHAVMTPPGSTLESHIDNISNMPTYDGKIDERTATGNETAIRRRAGLQASKDAMGYKTVGRQAYETKNIMKPFDEGAKFNKVGRLTLLSDIHARINDRAKGLKNFAGPPKASKLAPLPEPNGTLRRSEGSGPAHFIRFGHWPTNERSQNNVTGDYEGGVSVYLAQPHNKGWQAMVPSIDTDDSCRSCWGEDTMSCEQCGGTGKLDHQDMMEVTDPMDTYRGLSRQHSAGQTPAFLVSGELAGVGHDGEPLLRNVRQLHQLAPHQLAQPGFDSQNFDSWSNICPGCANCSGLSPIAKMALKDTPPPTSAPTPPISARLHGVYDTALPTKADWYNYTHLLPKESGLDLLVGAAHNEEKPTWPYLKAVLVHRGTGKAVGRVNGYLSKDGPRRLLEPHSSMNTHDPSGVPLRGRGYGKAMYEALLAHGLKHNGITHAQGGLHSPEARRVHESLSQKHGMAYQAESFYESDWGPYEYALKSEALNKVQTPPTFPKLGLADNRRETPLVTQGSLAFDNKQRLIAQHAGLKRLGPKYKDVYGLTSTQEGTACSYAVTDPNGPGKSDIATKQHEDFHLLMNRVEEKYGQGARKKLATHLYRSIHPLGQELLVRWHKEVMVKAKRSHEELLAGLLDWHNDPAQRRNYEECAKDPDPGYIKFFLKESNNLKSALRAVRTAASNVGPELFQKP